MKVYNHFMLLAYFFSSFLLFCNCINPDYDLSKDIDTDIVIGAGGIGFPIGRSERITIDKFIKDDKYFIPNGFKLSHTETIDRINLGDKISDNKEDLLLRIKTTVENTIPLEFKLRANVFSENGDSLKDIIVDEGYIKRGGFISATYTDIVLEINVPRGLLKQIYTVDIVVIGEVRFPINQLGLIDSQYLQMNDIVIRVKGGLDIGFKGDKNDK